MTEPVVEAWIEAVRFAYVLVKGEEAARLRGKRHRSFNDQGVHPLSHELGRIAALQDLEPVLSNAGFDPFVLRSTAAGDALDEFVRDVKEGKWPD